MTSYNILIFCDWRFKEQVWSRELSISYCSLRGKSITTGYVIDNSSISFFYFLLKCNFPVWRSHYLWTKFLKETEIEVQIKEKFSYTTALGYLALILHCTVDWMGEFELVPNFLKVWNRKWLALKFTDNTRNWTGEETFCHAVAWYDPFVSVEIRIRHGARNREENLSVVSTALNIMTIANIAKSV